MSKKFCSFTKSLREENTCGKIRIIYISEVKSLLITFNIVCAPQLNSRVLSQMTFENSPH